MYPEQHKQAALMKMCPQTLYDHITLNSDLFVFHDDLCNKIVKYIDLRSTSDRSRTTAQGGAVPMQIGAFGKGGKLKGGCKGYKGRFGKVGTGAMKGSKGKKGKAKGTEGKESQTSKTGPDGKENASHPLCNAMVVDNMVT